MQPFEYVVILSSLILGLGIAQLLQGSADIVSNWKRINFSLPHGLYIIVLFIIHVQEWWITYQYANEISMWSLPLVLAILSFPVVLFLQARMIFPTGPRGEETDLKLYFSEQWISLYTLGIITVVISILQNIFISGISISEQILLVAYFIIYLTFIIVRIKNMRLHTIFMIAQLLAGIIYIISEDYVL